MTGKKDRAQQTKPNFKDALAFAGAAPESTAGRQPPAGDTRLTVNIDENLHQTLKLEAVRRGATMGDIIEEWIREHLGEGE